MTTMTLAKALTSALRRALETDPRVVVMGEDVGRLGGVFRVTDGLQKDFGAARVVDTPLAESGIVGTAIGLALRGYRPVCEIKFDGFVYPAFDQIVSQLAKMRFRTGGTVSLPVVIRIPAGGGIGAVEHHSESNEAYFAHTAGLRVVCCSTPDDAHWMLRQAVAGDDPVIFYEPKKHYWTTGEVTDEVIDEVPGEVTDEVTDEVTGRREVPAGVLPLDRARVARPGGDLTLVTYGGTVVTCLDAAEIAAAEGVDLEVVDLRSLSPVDLDTVTASVARTGRCVVVHEAPVFAGLGAEIAASVTERCFDLLEAPVLRVGGWDTPYPPAKHEHEYLPDADRVLDATDRALAW